MLIGWLLQGNMLEAGFIKGGEVGHGIPDKNTVAGRFLEVEKGSSSQQIHIDNVVGQIAQASNKDFWLSMYEFLLKDVQAVHGLPLKDFLLLVHLQLGIGLCLFQR